MEEKSVNHWIRVAWQSHGRRRQKSSARFLPSPHSLCGNCESVWQFMQKRQQKNISRIAVENMQRVQFNCGQSSSIVSQMMMMITITRCNRLSSNYAVAWIAFSIDCQLHPFDSIRFGRCVSVNVHSRTCMYDVRVNKWIKSPEKINTFGKKQRNTTLKCQHSLCFLSLWWFSSIPNVETKKKWCNVTTAISAKRT